jgi:hypothetical protein
MASQTENLTTAQPEARKEGARKSAGPRTADGKRRSSQNARKHGLYSNANFFWDAAIALGEDPRDFERLLKGLIQARRPADTLEMVLVEDIALILWKKARLDRAEAAVQVCNLQKHDLDRRKQFIQVGRDVSDTLQSEVREKGLRRTLDAPGKFEQILSILDILVEMVEKSDFSSNMQEFLRGVYGEEPTLRGAGLYNNYWKLSEMKPGNQEFEDAKTLMRARLAEEISDVAQEYELFLHEHVENTRAARMAATAPSHAQWATIIRQQNALHRQLQQKIRLLEEIQEKRKKEEERLLDKSEASLRNPPDAPRGGGHSANLTRSAGPASPGPACRPEGRRYPQNETPRGDGQASNRKKILNRGNEPETSLQTQELADVASSKRTAFCPGKSVIEAKKRGISTQETAGAAYAPVAHRRAPAQAGAAQARLKIGVGRRPSERRRRCELIAWTYEQFHAKATKRSRYEQFHAKAQSTRRPQREAERNSFISFAYFASFAPLRETLCLSSDCFKRSKPLRRSGGRADLGRHPLGTLTRPCGKADAICRCAVRSRIPRNSGRAKEQGCATRSPQSGLGCGIVSRLAERLGFKIPDSGFGSRDSGVGSQLTTDN